MVNKFDIYEVVCVNCISVSNDDNYQGGQVNHKGDNLSPLNDLELHTL